MLISPTRHYACWGRGDLRLARRLRQTPSPGKLAAVFDDGRRIEGSLVSGWRGSGTSIARDDGGRPGVWCLLLDGLTADTAPLSEAVLEFHNGDRIRGTICGYVVASTEPRAKRSPGARATFPGLQATRQQARLASISIGCGGSFSTRPGRRATARRDRSCAATAG